jgi:nucleoside-diphosphate-sugar epimerase
MPADRAPILVIGAGWIGSAVATRLGRDGVPVVATTRSGTWRGSSAPPPRVTLRRLDLLRDDEAARASVFDGVRAAVACLAPGGEQDRRALYVGGARRFGEGCGAADLERAVWCSSTSALPAIDGPVDEECTESPEGERGRVQRDAEEAFREACERSGTPWVILRLAGLYGPGRELERVYRLARSEVGLAREPAAREEVLPGDGLEPTNLVHRDDVVAAIVAALHLDPGVSTLVHVVDHDHTTRRELVARLAEHLGVTAPRWECEGSRPRGKRVTSRRLAEILGVILAHPRHTP